MAEKSAAPASWGLAWLLLILSRTRATAGFLEVEMAGKMQMGFLNDNITISCKIPGSPYLDIKTIGITWFWKTRMAEPEVKVFEFFGDHQKAFRPGAIVLPWRLQRGDASLQLPGVQLGEAGEYRCELVVTPQKAEGRVWLEVVAYPAIKLFLEQTMVNDNEEKHLTCKSSSFYPETISIAWEKWTQKIPQYQEITEDIITGPTVKNEDGTFNVTSYLKLKPSLKDNFATYQCVVRHESLYTPQRIGLTLTGTASVKTLHLLWILIFPCIQLIGYFS